MKKLAVYIVLLLGLACKKEIQIDIADKPPVLVVNADLDPDSLFSFNLAQSQNIIDNGPIPYVTNATVEIFNKDTVFIEQLSHSISGIYRSPGLKPRSDSQYLFRINTIKGAFWCRETIPRAATCKLLDTITLKFFQGKSNVFQARLEITDDSAKENYYGLRMKRYFDIYKGIDTVLSEEWVTLETMDFILTENAKTKFSKKNLLFTDVFFRGQSPPFRIGGADLFDDPNEKTKKLVIYVTSYSKAGYEYYTSVNEHLFYQNDPFSQPTTLVGNIPGAFGAAVGQATKTLTVNFK